MSGFEVAGLVLAVIPLILEGLEAYPQSRLFQSTKSFLEAKRERREFASQLLLFHTEILFLMMNHSTLLMTADQQRDLTSPDNVGSKFFNVWKSVLTANSAEIGISERGFEDIKFLLDDMVGVLNEMLKHTEISKDASSESLRGIIKSHKDD